ncbi:MAG: hypothetical protein CMJ32_06120 [Phycisphaerae bacterium]|nr:hypothetical protein [Phycisphaerae bacterium]
MLVLGCSRILHAQELTVLQVTPGPSMLQVSPYENIRIRFDRPVDTSSVSNVTIRVYSRSGGNVHGRMDFVDGGREVVLVPDRPLASGEPVQITLASSIRGTDGTMIRPEGYSWRFWVRTKQAEMQLKQTQVLSTNFKGGESTIPYGGVATDLDGDGWIDLSLTNEGTDDVRVFMNSSDGHVLPMSPFSFAVGSIPSPVESADFDNDGHPDLCTANIGDGTISILLGNGDGTYGTQQSIEVGNGPRGIAVLDVDGDADMDIINPNSSSSNLSLVTNDGNGQFSQPQFLMGGVPTEWSVEAVDMNSDGITDLVVGGEDRISVLIGNGNGTFGSPITRNSAGILWQVRCGDLDGDGDEDVTSCNSTTGAGAVFFNNGAGQLSPPIYYSGNQFPIATDLGDFDGDGDLDWILSGYGGSWRIYANNGDGQFSLMQILDAPDSASCSLPTDLDNDGDLDLALIDENDDLLIIMKNMAEHVSGDFNDDGLVNGVDLAILLAAWKSQDPMKDLNGDGSINGIDLAILLANWTP